MSQLTSIKQWFSRDIGQYHEKIAEKYLQQQGLKPIEQNFNCRYGELDLIMTDGETIVFIEVKFRQQRHYGGAIHAVSQTKQRKLVKTAQYYLQQKHWSNRYTRFDVVAIDANSADDTADQQINWIKNAFYAA